MKTLKQWLFIIYVSSLSRFQYRGYQCNESSEWNIEEGYPKDARNVYPRRALLAGSDNSLEIFLAEFQENTDYLCADILQGFKVRYTFT